MLMHVPASMNRSQGTKACPLADSGMLSSPANYEVCHLQICASQAEGSGE